VTIIVDVANVMGSRPDGWWRDRAGAAVRLHDQVARLAASGRAVLPSGAGAPAEAGAPAGAGPSGEHGPPSGEHGPPAGEHGPPAGEHGPPGFVLVLEGAARAAAARVPSAGSTTPSPGEVRVVQARGSGDDTIVAVARELPGRRVVVTADRGLRDRSVAVGATVLGPGWLLGLLRE